MKTNALLSLLLIMVTSLAFAQSDFNLDSSKINWVGKKNYKSITFRNIKIQKSKFKN